ncbi:MAG: hypothetical protein WA973_12945 [Mesorhizobium sp.]
MFRVPEITYPLVIDTIGKMLGMGEEITVHCHVNGCEHSGRVNLVRLGYRLGFDHGCQDADLRPYFYCPKCRGAGRPDRKISFRSHPLTEPHSDLPRGPCAGNPT